MKRALTDTELIKAWLRLEQRPKPKPHIQDEEAAEALDLLQDEDPEHLFRLMDEVIKHAPTDQVLSMVGAGYLENIICYKGE